MSEGKCEARMSPQETGYRWHWVRVKERPDVWTVGRVYRDLDVAGGLWNVLGYHGTFRDEHIAEIGPSLTPPRDA